MFNENLSDNKATSPVQLLKVLDFTLDRNFYIRVIFDLLLLSAKKCSVVNCSISAFLTERFKPLTRCHLVYVYKELHSSLDYMLYNVYFVEVKCF